MSARRYRRSLIGKIFNALLISFFAAYALANFAGSAMLFVQIETPSYEAFEPGIELLIMGLISSCIAWVLWRV